MEHQALPNSDGRLDDNLYVVVRVYNEAPVVRDVVVELLSTFINVIVVDDGSTDGTLRQLQGLPIHLLQHSVNLGAGAAMQTGIEYALRQEAKAVIIFDADGQHRVEDASGMYGKFKKQGCDVVIGSRFLGTTTNMPWTRKLILKLAIIFSNLTTRTKLTDTHNGLRLFSRKAASVLNITQTGMAYASEMLHQLVDQGMEINEYPVTINYTDYSLSKGQSSLNALNILIDLFIGRFMK